MCHRHRSDPLYAIEVVVTTRHHAERQEGGDVSAPTRVERLESSSGKQRSSANEVPEPADKSDQQKPQYERYRHQEQGGK